MASIPPYGLLTNMSHGIREGLIDFMTMKNAQRSQQRQDLLSGIQDGPNGPQFTPEKQSQIEEMKQAQHLQNQAVINKFNPDSAISKTGIGLLKNQFHTDVPEGSSYGEVEGLIKPAETAESYQMRKDIQDLKNRSIEDNRGKKDEDKENARFDKLTDQINPNKARAGNLAKSQQMVNAAQRIEVIFDQFPDGNLPETPTQELVAAHAALLNGGSPFAAQLEHMVPQSLQGNLNAKLGWLTNDPKGLGQQEFINQLKNSSHREKAVAQKQVRDAQANVLANYSDLYEKNPQKYKRLVHQFLKIDPDAELDEYGLLKEVAPKAQGSGPGGALSFDEFMKQKGK